MGLKRILKYLGLGLLTVLVVVGIWQRELIAYGWMQLKGQLKVVNEAIPLEEFLALPETTDEQKNKVRIIQEAKQFAFDELGINYSENYSKIFDQQGKPSMYVVTACQPFEFRAKTWRFPVLGAFPYKGFFEREKAVEEARRIRVLPDSLDVGLRTAGGWSTLGWFQDPVLSNMLNRSEGDLASLIIHELTHGTLFVKDSVTFNENLATFIGDAGAIRFLEKKYGKGSEEAEAYKAQIADEERFKSYVLNAAKSLETLYGEFTNETYIEKERQKELMIDHIISNYDTVSFESDRYKQVFARNRPNNTYFMSFLRYNSQQDILKEELDNRFNGNLMSYMEYLKTKYPSL